MRDWWPRSPAMARAEVWRAAAVGAVLSLVQFFTLLPNIDSHIAADPGDPLPQSWQVAWGGHALLNQPFAFWQANQFWPEKDTLAFSDALVGYSPFGMFGSGPHAALVRYNLLFLFAFAFAFFAIWLLARELGVPNIPAMVGGAAFAYSPWRLEQAGHMHVISSGGIALALFLLLRGYRRGSWKLVLAGWVAAAWQQSIGFTLGLQMDYLMIAMAIVGVVAWVRFGRPSPDRHVIFGTAAGIGLFALTAWWLSRPYLRVLSDHNRAGYTLSSLYSFSPSLNSFFTPPQTSLLFGSGIGKSQTGLFGAISVQQGPGFAEKVLYPGIVITVLAIVGLTWKGIPKAIRVGLGVSALVLAVLSLGVHPTGIGHYLPYRLVFDLLPGWNGIRAPGRIHTLTTLALALLAAAGAARAAEHFKQREWHGRRVGALAAGALLALVLIEGSGIPFPAPMIKSAPAALASAKPPLLQLPAAPTDNRFYLLWSTDGFPKMVNGRSTYIPPSFRKALKHAATFPSASSIRWLRAHGVRTVVVHTEFSNQRLGEKFEGSFHRGRVYRSPTWAQATARRAPPGSGVTRTLSKPLVIYHLRR